MKLLLVALLLVSSPAHACHFFKDWRYPQPQRCDDGHHGGVFHMKQVPAPDKSWYVEVTRMPDAGDKGFGTREEAVKWLRIKLQKPVN